MAKPLIVIDVNGVLCEKVYVENLEKERDKILSETSFTTIILNKFVVYIRPNVHEFLEFCFANYDVGFFSSTTYQNANRILGQLLTKDQNMRAKFLWYRDRTRLDPDWKKEDKKTKKFDTIKMIQDVLECPAINEDRRYSVDNTILLDDSETKTRFNDPQNILVVKTFNHDDAEDNQLLGIMDVITHKFMV